MLFDGDGFFLRNLYLPVVGTFVQIILFMSIIKVKQNLKIFSDSAKLREIIYLHISSSVFIISHYILPVSNALHKIRSKQKANVVIHSQFGYSL